MKALSVRAPWPWAIFHAGKDIENRDWPTSVRGRVYIHQSKSWQQSAIDLDWMDIDWMADESLLLEPDFEKMRANCGCLIGSVEIVDCVSRSHSPWFVGKFGFVLRNPILLPRPIPYKGQLGFFDIDTSLLK